MREDSVGPAVDASRPQPSLTELGRLIEESRGTGTTVELSLSPELEAYPELLSASTGRHLYRIVQEALTNARRHAPGLPVSVDVGGRPGWRVTLRVENPLQSPAAGPETVRQRIAAPSSGLGLAGLAERAKLTGGTLKAGPDANDRFVLEAWLPWKN